jgi:hypothetical protein
MFASSDATGGAILRDSQRTSDSRDRPENKKTAILKPTKLAEVTAWIQLS